MSNNRSSGGGRKDSNNNNKKGDSDENLLDQTIVDKLNAIQRSIELSETNLRNHIDQKIQSLSADISNNEKRIDTVSITAERASTLANENYDGIQQLNERVGKLETEKNELVQKINDMTKRESTQLVRINIMQKRLEDQTCRNSRNSLMIRGIPETDNETWDNTRVNLCNALAPVVGKDADDINKMIERVHRGKARQNQNNENNGETPGRTIHCRFYDWNDSEFVKQQAIKNGRGHNIFIEQRYGPDTTYRQNLAKAERKKLKADKVIVSGYVKYPAKLFVKYEATQRHYSFHSDFSNHDVPLLPAEDS